MYYLLKTKNILKLKYSIQLVVQCQMQIQCRYTQSSNIRYRYITYIISMSNVYHNRMYCSIVFILILLRHFHVALHTHFVHGFLPAGVEPYTILSDFSIISRIFYWKSRNIAGCSETHTYTHYTLTHTPTHKKSLLLCNFNGG